MLRLQGYGLSGGEGWISDLPMVSGARVEQAFILGAGLGTRLRPLTGLLPKPLVPLYHRPLAAWAMDACVRAGIRRFAINTHHLPEAWHGLPQQSGHGGADVTFFHEPKLLDTGGGLKNIERWAGGGPLLVHNGDIFTTLPLEKLVAAHSSGGCPVTLALRSHGAERRVGVDASGSRVTDMRHLLGIDPGSHVFSGVYCMEPSFFERLPQGGGFSVIPAMVELAREGLLGAAVIDEGEWLDLGDRTAYLEANLRLNLAAPVHPDAKLARGAVVERSVIGPGCEIAADAWVCDSVLWPGSRVLAGGRLEKCVVFSGRPVSGSHRNADL